MSWNEALDIYLEKAPKSFEKKWSVFDREVREIGGVRVLPIQKKIDYCLKKGLEITQSNSCACSRKVTKNG